MTRKDIKQAIKDSVDDQSVSDTLLNSWVQAADEKVQTWRPPADENQSFDYWDYLKDLKTYATQANINKYPLPDNYRAFVELAFQDDTNPYNLIDYRDREKFKDHAVWILGKFFYVKATPGVDGKTITFAFVRFSDAFATDNDEPEIEPIYHQAHVEWGKKQYYGQQGDADLEKQAEANFDRIMVGKWRDQELARMAAARETAEIQKQYLI